MRVGRVLLVVLLACDLSLSLLKRAVALERLIGSLAPEPLTPLDQILLKGRYALLCVLYVFQQFVFVLDLVLELLRPVRSFLDRVRE